MKAELVVDAPIIGQKKIWVKKFINPISITRFITITCANWFGWKKAMVN